MALRIRLTRLGAKKKPFYRLVVIERSSPRDGRFVEVVGTYNPMMNPPEVNLETERIKYWLGNGASPSETVESLLRKQDLIAPKAEKKSE